MSLPKFEGFWGTFRIEVEGREIFNRWKTRGIWGRIGFGRTPEPAEIVTLVRELQSVSDGHPVLAEPPQ